MTRAPFRFAALVATLAIVATAAPPAGAASREIAIRDNYYATKYLVITVGDSITWTNGGDNAHTVTAFDGSYDSSPKTGNTCDDGNLLTQEDCIAPGASFSHTYSSAGTFDYYCKVHGSSADHPDPQVSASEQPCGMCARIVVRHKSESTATATPTRTATPTKLASRSPTPSASPSKKASPTATSSVIAAPSEVGSKGGGGRALLALLLILGLGGAGFLVWRRYLAPPQ